MFSDYRRSRCAPPASPAELRERVAATGRELAALYVTDARADLTAVRDSG